MVGLVGVMGFVLVDGWFGCVLDGSCGGFGGVLVLGGVLVAPVVVVLSWSDVGGCDGEFDPLVSMPSTSMGPLALLDEGVR